VSRAGVAEIVRTQAAGCRMLGSPLYAGLLDRVAGDVEAAGPSWEVLSPFEEWDFGSAYVLRMMGAVNRLVLTGSAPSLEPHFAPGGDAEAAWEPLRALLSERGGEVRDIAVERGVQTNEVGRCAALAPAFHWLAGGGQLRLLEIGASGGLNLRFDAYRYEDRWGDPESPVHLVDRYPADAAPPFGPREVEVVERRGCDPSPVDAASEEGALTLLSYVWPDQEERVALLRGALEVARRVPVRLDEAAAGAWLAETLAELTPADGTVTVVFHSIVWQYIADQERERIRSVLADVGEVVSYDAPLAWLRMEADGADTRLDVTTWPGGEERLLGRAGYHGRPVRWLG
jgi:hypothetical protein